MSETRTQLKAIALEQIQLDKLAAASFRELGKAAGIKSSSVHYHFQSRDNLLTEVYHDFANGFFNELESRTSGLNRPRQRLLALFGLFEEMFKRNAHGMTSAYAAGFKELSIESHHEVKAFLNQLETWIAQTLSSASFLPISRESLSRVCVSLLEGALLLDRLNDDPYYLEAAKEWICSLSSL